MGKTTCEGYWNSKCIFNLLFLIEKGTFCVHTMRAKICFEPYWTLNDKKKIAGNAFSFLKKDRPDSFEKKSATNYYRIPTHFVTKIISCLDLKNAFEIWSEMHFLSRKKVFLGKYF